MAHSNVSIFIPHIGCPNCCSFCNQHTITGQADLPNASYIKNILTEQASRLDPKTSEIAFFGGSFTAINHDYMLELLNSAQPFIENGSYSGIRISTRPDCINDKILKVLKAKNVTTIELGAQSTSEEVLKVNDRGHTYTDIVTASNKIKEYGFNLVLQMMVGLYKSTPLLDKKTAEDLAELCPNEVRIYPVVILKGTKLSELFGRGEYVPYSLDLAVDICSDLLIYFQTKEIKVIKLGLHASEIVEQVIDGGLYHPAFRELCESKNFLKSISLNLVGIKKGKIFIETPLNKVSQAIGHKSLNKKILLKNGYIPKFTENSRLHNYETIITEEESICT